VVDFHIAFFAISILTVVATIPFIRMDSRAGALVSGHKPGLKDTVPLPPVQPAAE
jgi:hypothetical protein